MIPYFKLIDIISSRGYFSACFFLQSCLIFIGAWQLYNQLFFVICCDRQVQQHKNLTYSSIMQAIVTYSCNKDIKSTLFKSIFYIICFEKIWKILKL
jgi:hypothetical protein